MMSDAELRTRGDASPQQRDELHRLIRERAVRPAWLQQFSNDVRRAAGLSTSKAEDGLIYLRSLARKGAEPTYATPEQGETLRGLARARLVPGKICEIRLRQYRAGEMTYIEADRTICEWLRLSRNDFLRPEQLRHPTGHPAPDGYFALIAADGKPRFYRIHTAAASGRRSVEQVTGEKPERRTSLRGVYATKVLNAVAKDPDEAGRRYADIRKRCRDCNTELRRTDQPGYPHGYGLDCWSKREQPTTPQPLEPGKVSAQS